jgi:hypothetical protein
LNARGYAHCPGRPRKALLPAWLQPSGQSHPVLGFVPTSGVRCWTPPWLLTPCSLSPPHPSPVLLPLVWLWRCTVPLAATSTHDVLVALVSSALARLRWSTLGTSALFR